MLLAPVLLLLGALSDPGGPPGPVPACILCTPDSIEVQGQGKRPVENPVAAALRTAQPGTVVTLEPGNYPPFTIGFQSGSPANAAIEGGQPGLPIVIEGSGPGVRIVGVEGDTIAIDQRIPNGYITFRNLEIVPGRRAGVMFYERGDGRTHRGYSFEDCHILGQFDHATGQGRRSKWGLWGHRLEDFRFVGVRAPARVVNISDEHAFYLLNPAGPITLENIEASGLGRTFCQITARPAQGPPGAGDVTVRDCRVQDACLGEGDGYKGGSAFTLAGRLEGTYLFEHNSYRAGFQQGLRRLTRAGQPYGTGAFAAWEADGAGPNDVVLLRDNDFELAGGCGDRPVVAIGGCRKVLILGKNRFVSGGAQPALSLDPTDLQGRPTSRPNGSVYLAPATELGGALLLGGKAPSDKELDALHLQKGRRRAPPPPPPATGDG